MYNTADSIMSGESEQKGGGSRSKGRLAKKVRSRILWARKRLHKLSALTDNLVNFALPEEMHTAFVPESPYVTTPVGRRLKAATAKGKPRREYSRGYATKYQTVPVTRTYKDPKTGEVKTYQSSIQQVVGKKEKPRGEPLFRDVVRHPVTGETKILNRYAGKLGSKVDVGGVRAEVVGKYPAYSKGTVEYGGRRLQTARYRPHAYLKARFDIESERLRNELIQKAAPETDVKKALRTHKQEIMGEYLKQVQKEAGKGRLGVRETQDRMKALINREIQAHRDYRAGELREARAIVHARGVPLRTARVESERLSEHVARLRQLTEERKTGIQAIRERAKGRLKSILERGVARIDPQVTPSVLPEEISRRAGHLLEPFSQKMEHGPLTEYQKSEMARHLQAGATARTAAASGTKMITPERVGKLHERLERLRDVATTPGGEAEIREKLVRKGGLFHGVPKVTVPEKGYPFLKKAGLGALGAGVLIGGAIAAKKIWFPPRKKEYVRKMREYSSRGKEIRFAELPPEAQRILDKAAQRLWEQGKRGSTIIRSPRMKRQAVLTRYRNIIRKQALKKFGDYPTIPGHPNAPEWKKLYEGVLEENTGLRKAVRSVEEKGAQALEAERAAREPIIAAEAAKRHAVGYRQGQQREAERGKLYREEQIAQVRGELGAKHAAHVSRLKWGGAGLVTGAGVGGYILGRGRRQRDHQFSILENIRQKISGEHEKGPSAYHDIAIGALEGGAAYPASDYLIRRFAPRGSGLARKIAVGGAVGGVATGLIGIGVSNILRGKRKIQAKRAQQLHSRLKEIRFATQQQRQVRTNQRALVARDRYLKQIKERDINTANRQYIHTALLGGALGALLKKAPTKMSKAVLTGAGLGIGAQALTREYTAGTKDVFGERSVEGKRIGKIPTVVGAGLLGYHGYKKLRNLAFASKRKPIQFQEEYDPNDPLTKWSRKWIYKKDYSTAAHAQKLKKWGGRTARTLRDIREARAGVVPVDTRGRPRKREWEKPWVAAVGTIAALKGGIWGVGKLRKVVREAPLKSWIGQTREGFLTGEYGKKVPGLQKIGGFYQGVKKDIKRLVYKGPKEPEHLVSSINPKTGKPKTPKQLSEEIATAKERAIFKSIAGGKLTKEAFKPAPKRRKPEEEWSDKSRVIRFGQTYIDNPLYPKGEKRSIQHVPIKDIISHQDTVIQHVVRKYKKKPGKALPTLHKIGGKYYVEDGNNRIVAKKEQGEKTVRASVRELRSRLREIRLAEVLPYWDIRDERGRSARVYAPGAQRRYREPMPEWRKKKNFQHILEGGIAGTALLGAAATIAAGRRGYRVGREVGRASIAGSTGRHVAYHAGEYLEPVAEGGGLFAWVRRPKPPRPPTVPLSSRLKEIHFDRYDDVKRRVLTEAGVGAGALGAGVGAYALLRRPGRLPVRGAVKAIRETAQKHGFARVHWHDKPGLLHKIYSRIAEPADIHADVIANRAYFPRHTKAVVFDPESTGKLRSATTLGQMNKTAKAISKSKLAEYRIARRMGLNIPETAPLGDPKTLGKRWIAKPATGSMSKALTAADFAKHDPLHPDLAAYKVHRKEVEKLRGNEYYKADARLSHHPGAKRYHVEQALKHPERYVRQRKLDIAKEYRVHMIGGEPLGVSSARHSVRQFFLSRNKPAEAAAAAMMKNVHPKLKKNLLAMDVVRTKKGGWHVIETNPGSESGFLTPSSGTPIDLRGPHALYKAVTGRYSKLVAGAGGAATATGVAGVGTAGALIAQRKKSQS